MKKAFYQVKICWVKGGSLWVMGGHYFSDPKKFGSSSGPAKRGSLSKKSCIFCFFSYLRGKKNFRKKVWRSKFFQVWKLIQFSKETKKNEKSVKIKVFPKKISQFLESMKINRKYGTQKRKNSTPSILGCKGKKLKKKNFCSLKFKRKTWAKIFFGVNSRVFRKKFSLQKSWLFFLYNYFLTEKIFGNWDGS